jgi:hypothetical protein
MNPSPASLSDEALAQLIFESKTTARRVDIRTSDVFGRVQRFSQLYGSLSTKPEGVALLYQEPGTGAIHGHAFVDKVVVGRLSKSERNPAGCDLAVEDDQMSKRHFEIVLADGFYLLRDLESRNGTYVNDDAKRIDETVLKGGDIILAGHGLFVFTGD